MKPLLKFCAYTIGGFLGLVACYLLVAFCLSRIAVPRESDPGREVTVYIKTNGVHTDIVVPTRNEQMDWSREVSYAHTKSKDTTLPWLGMGWGDKGFYLETPTWADLKFRTAFRAAFGLSTTAIHATYYRQLKENESCRKIEISKAQYARLVRYIRSSFQRDERGNTEYIPTNANYGSTDAFYEAKGTYSGIKTCNTWTNRALKISGQRCCLWTAFDKGIFLKYQEKEKLPAIHGPHPL